MAWNFKTENPPKSQGSIDDARIKTNIISIHLQKTDLCKKVHNTADLQTTKALKVRLNTNFIN